MSAPLLKPAKRQRKPPKLLLCSSSPIARHSRPARRVRPRPQGTSEVAKLEREADRLCSLITLGRTSWCVRCQVMRATDTAHVFGRRHNAVRHDLDNLLPLCRVCHQAVGSAFLSKPSRMERFYGSLYGYAKFEELKARAQRQVHVTAVYLRCVIAGLKASL